MKFVTLRETRVSKTLRFLIKLSREDVAGTVRSA